ncbi:kinase-like domain-containing protein [Rhizophagus irregularis DAOM 181602=DAOM 197198]|uniref:Kinase-like domain-containing protein n=1 Tax=Rhizophagus irregularis (strain DAOM 181602 / DAOM 197198 / MUCL 43194) TaxID=747089 RepID=A0A2P4Q8Y5_RHIID|nr:kinase-like domain-containing protein [Rhizophagus irregularis DAOM 181602=DAOM 197198]POG74099.1 kinase-like domain-containing protein [Rhizophagus irregularis DAOM 181602=DAOM 197198]|eukprot:XP_025180965.1 kinase-like domain-containing protein [Rhizophagus irregularis DAOM 181602=DAOM 197198]
MSTLRYGLIYATNNRAITLTDNNIYNDIHKRFEFQRQTILAYKILTNDEKTEAIRDLTQNYDRNKIIHNSGTKRICENCNQECLATLYCEYCVRNYLKENFSNWTSGNDDIDNLIQKCQMETLMPNTVVEWIPYNNLENIEYLTKGGISEIYTADWINGEYDEWDFGKKQLERGGTCKIILKRLENVESANQSWFEEAKSHLTISNKWADVVRCYGLTQDPSNGNYMLVMMKRDMDLRKYLQQNHSQLTWKKRINITFEIINAIFFIHKEKAIHRDLHSGNILYSQLNNSWCVSDLGFCGPADKSSTSIYGNLPYIAPEVIIGREYTFASDIYSIAILMWEISSGQPPFINYEHENDIVMNIIKDIRTKIKPGTPLEYKNLMKECWDADPLKRPDTNTLWKRMNKINLYYQNMSDELIKSEMEEMTKVEENYTSSRLFTSKIHNFGNLPEPRNATEEEQEGYHSKLYDFNIPNNIDDFNKSNKRNSKSSKVITMIRGDSEKLPEEFIKLQINSNDDEKEITQHVDDDDEVYNNPNLHSKEQVELEIPDDGF